ncbi:hypothetical protein [Streptomyces sp. NPDC052107]|uniref:hypothetical protein n=1 Tax=Streptomyces sp. NPDC052107 TaxID=3155632 RepID=UPI003414E2B6
MVRAFEWHGTPAMPAAAPSPADWGHRRVEQAPTRTNRGLRAWLRRRSPRPARV